MFLPQSAFANDLYSFIKALNKHLEPAGIKVLDYRPAVEDLRGYELTLTISDPSLATSQEPIQKIFINKDFNTAILTYKKEKIHENLRNNTKIELVSMYSKLFNQSQEKYYKRLPIFKKEYKTPFNNDIALFNDSNRSFIIDNDKKFIYSANVLFFNGTEITNYSDDKRKIDLYELKEIVKNIYEKHPQITFLPEKMDNLIVIFFSKDLPYTVDIFKNIDEYKKNDIGLLFLPYYDLQKDKTTSKDYKLFCQKDFGLIVEYSILESNQMKEDFECATDTEYKIDTTTKVLFDIYTARFNILNKFHLDYKQPYYYLYKQELFIDYDLSKELN
jgi:hypothetical protein